MFYRILEGDQLRILDTSRAHALGLAPEINLNDGIAETVAWYRAHADATEYRYNVFTGATGNPAA